MRKSRLEAVPLILDIRHVVISMVSVTVDDNDVVIWAYAAGFGSLMHGLGWQFPCRELGGHGAHMGARAATYAL